ncbi:hypothetical protein O9H85_36950 [Paenibacillus filicis]|uniref:Zinc-finger domain-containing protein n=1 Tax=Paenibacillus gyeongsangnamensis TaxID=3388067 RepID=A0ABT4QLN5_9BACL|nr:hypothetical protein [Paenibacillus filicis]MCZ8517783.1 hypothetical protein [Paenibacillus filicis]
MRIMHPEDKELQRYLNQSCDEIAYQRIHRHLRMCSLCRGKLKNYMELDRLLDSMPLLEAPKDLPDRVARRLRYPESRPPVKRPFWRSELANGLIATAATFIFVATGIMGKLVTLNPEALGSDVEERVLQLYRWLEFISHQWLT